MDELTKW